MQFLERREGDDYVYDTDRGDMRVVMSGVRESSGDLTAIVRAYYLNGRGPESLMAPSRLNLTAPRSRAEVAKTIAARREPSDIDAQTWGQVIEYCCGRTYALWEQGDPIIDMSEVEVPPWSGRYCVSPLLPEGETTIVVADGGCIAPGTMIEGPNGQAAVESLTGPSQVWALGPRGPVAAWASKPWAKGVADLYEITMQDGRNITVTGEHRFLTPAGWCRTAALGVGAKVLGVAPSLPASTSAPFLSGLQQGGRRYQGTRAGWTGRYSPGFHRYGQQLQRAGGSGQVAARQRGDALGRTRFGWHMGGSLLSRGRTRLGQLSDRRSRSSSSPVEPWRASVGYRAASSVSRPYRSHTPNAPLFLEGLNLEQQVLVAAQQKRRSDTHRDGAYDLPPSESLYHCTISTIRYVGRGVYYDIHVPGYENYLAEGVWNHNSGKSTLATALTASAMTGSVFVPGLVPSGRRMGLYLDWESNKYEHGRRLQALCRGAGIEGVPPMLYRTNYRALADDISTFRREIAQQEVRFVVVDSAVPASGDDIKDTAAPRQLFNALRSLGDGVTRLVLAHMSKAEAEKENGRARVLGCYSEDTEILTRSGWKRHDEWQAGEEILCFDMGESVLRWSEPERLWEYDYQGEMIHVRAEGIDALVTPNHNLVLQPAWRDKPGAVTRRPRHEKRWLLLPADSIKSSRWLTPYSTPIAGEDEERPVVVGEWEPSDGDAFLRLLGWWISEGSLSYGRHRDSPNALNLCQAEGPLAESMCETLDALGVAYSRWSMKPNRPDRAHEQPICLIRTKKSAPLAVWFAANGGTGAASKRIPDIVWSLSTRQKQVFLDALVDGDGTRFVNGRMGYTTTSAILANQVQRLAIETGRAATVYDRGVPQKGRLRQYYVTIQRPERRTHSVASFNGGTKRSTHWERLPYDGKVYCFTTQTGAYLTRRNGKIAIQGNSVMYENLARSVWEMRRSNDAESNELVVGLFHRKMNGGRLRDPFALRVLYGEDEQPYRFESVRIEDYPDLNERLPAGDRLRDLLAQGIKSTSDLSELLDKPTNTVLKMLKRRSDVVQIGGGRGRGNISQWGLRLNGAEPYWEK